MAHEKLLQVNGLRLFQLSLLAEELCAQSWLPTKATPWYSCLSIPLRWRTGSMLAKHGPHTFCSVLLRTFGR